LLLTDSLQKSIDQLDSLLDGWTFGQLVIEDQKPFLQLENGDIIPATGIVEVKNGDFWERVDTYDYYIITIDGWPAYAGMKARMKPVKA